MTYNIHIRRFLTLTRLGAGEGLMKHAWEWLFQRWDRSNCLFGNVAIIGCIFFQCLDGILTYAVIKIWGLGVEVNPLIVWFMSIMGVGLGLVVTRIWAIGIGLLFYRLGFHNVVALAAGYYLIIVALPWGLRFITT